MIKTVIFDFGGVLAEEGFREGLLAIARENGLDPDAFFFEVDSLIEVRRRESLRGLGHAAERSQDSTGHEPAESD